MNKIIVTCLAVVTLALISSGCASDPSHSTTTTSQQTTTPGPITTTTTDTQTK